MDQAISTLSKDLDRLRTQYQAGSKTIHDELTEKMSQYQASLEARAESTLNLVGKSGQLYLEEIENLKKEVTTLSDDKQQLSKQLDARKSSEDAMSAKIRKMQDKIEVFEQVEENRGGAWFDSGLDVTGAMDIDRITRSLKKAMEYIELLKKKIVDLEAQNNCIAK